MSKGMMLIDAFRAERQKQRKALRESSSENAPPESEVEQAAEPGLTHAVDDKIAPVLIDAVDEIAPVLPRAADDEIARAVTRAVDDRGGIAEPASGGGADDETEITDPAQTWAADPEAGTDPAPGAAQNEEPPETTLSRTTLDLAQPPQPRLTFVEGGPAAIPAACSCGERFSPYHGEGHAPERPLTEIGIGPAMTIRLRHLGLHTVRDMANADAETLRGLLGDLGRLIDVDGWIRAARRRVGAPEL